MITDERKTVEGEPTLVVTVTGHHDVYRFAHHLRSGQCEFADVGWRTFKYLKRKLDAGRWQALVRYMHGGRVTDGS